MKVYFLEVGPSDLQWLEDGKYTTNVIDWYSNDSYQNFSVLKSSYGFTPVRATWVGTTRLDTNEFLTWEDIRDLDENFYTDSGEVIDGRFIDNTGRIDVISFNVSEESSYVRLQVYHSDVSDDEFFEEEWDSKGPVSTSHEVALIDSERYGKLIFDFGEESPPPMFLAYIRVEIDGPVMMPLYRGTRQLIDQFPEWMAMAELPEEAATPEMATPTSIGGSFLNAIAGEWLDDIRRKLSYRDFQKYITTVDLSQMAWAWRTSKLPRFIVSIKGDGVELARTADQEEFRNAVNDHACYIDYENDALYTTQKYTQLIIDQELFDQTSHHMWNYLDEIGLFVDLPRLELESNEEYQVRIIDVYKNRGGVGVEQLKNALRRELSLWRYFDQDYGYELTDATPGIAATPDSDYEWALPDILDMEDLEAMNDPDDPRRYFDPDGMPTVRFVELVERLSREYPTTWGRFSWGKAIWDLGGKDYSGYNVTPYRYDAEQLDDRYIQSGVGDGDDLYVFRPDVVTGPREFEADIVARGKEKIWRTEYPRVDFDMHVRGIGMRDVYHHPEKTVSFTLELITNDATPQTFVHSFTMSSKSDVGPEDFEAATPNTPKASESSWATYELFSDDDTTSPEVEFRDPITNELYDGTGIIPVEDIAEIKLVQGRWQAGSYDQIETQDHFEAWLSYDPDIVLTYDSGPIEFLLYDEATPATPSFDMDMIGSIIVMRSIQHVGPTPTEWASDPQEFRISVNGIAPYLTPVPLEFEYIGELLGNGAIGWDDYVTDRFIELQIETTNDALETDIELATPTTGSEYGGTTRNENNETIFIPASLIQIDGDATWVEGRKLLNAATEAVTITIATGAEYPITFPVWEMREWTSSITVDGVVDENGPWRNNVPPSPGNTNYNFEILENTSRDDLGVPHTEDFIVTWIGVQSSNSRVLVWLDNNTVKPAIENDFAANYPETAIEETVEEGTGDYYYSPIVVRARVRPEPDPQWNPQVHSGYFYDRNQEYYFYANKITEEALTDEMILDGVARQGSPIIITTDGATPEVLRQVAFSTEMVDATPVPMHLSTTNQEWVRGTGHAVLYAAYHDIYDITVEDDKGNNITDVVSSNTNEVSVLSETEFGARYLITYTVRNSYCVDYDYVVGDQQYTRITFDTAPDDKYIINYEGSTYDPATPVDLPLNPMYSMRNEGFIFISHNEYTLDSIRVRMSPGTVIADGSDYIMISIDSMDKHGNPKPNQNFELSTTFGFLDKTNVTTDHDGFAIIILTSEDEGATPSATPSETGTLTISGDVGAEVDFYVEEPNPPEPTLAVVVKAEKIQADGFSQNLVFGRVEDVDFQPIEGAVVSWQKRRSIYELFTSDDLDKTVLQLDGELGSYASYAAPSVNQDIEIIIDVHPFTWTQQQTLVSQYESSGSQRSWQIRTTDTGGLHWAESQDGISYIGTPLVESLASYGREIIRITRDATTGIVEAFIWHNGEWVTQGSIEGMTGDLHASTGAISIGTISGGVLNMLGGRVHSLSVTHNGAPVIDEDFGESPWEAGDEDITKNDWTLHGGAKIIQGLSGEVTTNQDGLFTVGPFTTTRAQESGYWFMSLETTVGQVTIGDVVFWYEYPTAVLGVENTDGLPQLPVQMQTPVGTLPPYSLTVKYPISYDEQATPPDEQDPDIQWLPPTWYAIAAWEQYQMGIRSHKIHKLM